jgi:branched-chain amino acid transport system substrate-binding protein
MLARLLSWASIVALVAIGAPPARAQVPPDITIGVITELTGAGATYGLGIAQGAEMAVRDVNAAGGIGGRKLKLMVADGGSNPARSAIAMRRLMAANVDIVVGGWGSQQVRVNMDIAEQSGMPYVVVGATHPDITSPRNQWTLRVIQTDAVMAEQLAKVAIDRLRASRIAVMYDSNDYGIGNREVFVAALQRHGVEPVVLQSFATSETHFEAQLQRLQSARPDVIAVFGTLPAAPAILQQARAMGIQARFVGTGGLANEALITAAGQAAEGTVLMTYFSEEVDADAKAWADRYRREFAAGAVPARPVLAAWEYRAIRGIVAPCLDRAGTDRTLLRNCLRMWRGRLFGIPGEVHFDASGQLVQPALTVEVRDGVFRLLGATR